MSHHHRGSLPEYSPRMDRKKAESYHISDKLYHQQNGNARVFDNLSLNRDPYYTQPKAYYELPGAERVDSRKPKDPKSVGDVFHRFSDTTSLQGIPFFTAATRWYAKVFWAALFLAATGVWLLHSIVLINSYTAYDTNSQVKITFDKLEFPTVSLCNINPIREHTVSVYGTEELQELFGLLAPFEMDTTAGTSDSTSQGTGDTGTSGDNNNQGTGDTGSSGDNNNQGAGDIGSSSNNNNNQTTGDTGRNSNNNQGGTAPGSNNNNNQGSGGGTSNPGRRKRQTEVADDDYERDHDFSVFASVNWTEYADVGSFGEYLEGDYSSTTLARLLLQEMVAQLPDYNRTKMGHRLNDMLLGCSYDGAACQNRDFHRYLDIHYGNCFSFNSKFLKEKALTSVQSGSDEGLDIVLYVQNYQYVKGVQQGRGVRLYVHPFGTQPFVQQSGISIPTGFQTYVGLRQVSQSRLGGKYGRCGDNDAYETYYGNNFTYTLEACSGTCVDRTVSAQCGCFRRSRKQFYNDMDIQSKTSCKSDRELRCIDNIEDSYATGKLTCGCSQPCSTTNYDYVLSYDQWPDESLWDSLKTAVCQSVSPGECDHLDQIPADSRDSFLSKNFVHIKVFYRDLNLELITEVPSYEDIQFYSDMGGAIGLWLGASVITLFELGDFAIRLIQYCCKRNMYKRRKEKQKRYNEEQSSRAASAPVSLQGTPRQLRRVMDDHAYQPSPVDPYHAHGSRDKRRF